MKSAGREFLEVYGIAILFIILVIVVLSYFGYLDSLGVLEVSDNESEYEFYREYPLNNSYSCEQIEWAINNDHTILEKEYKKKHHFKVMTVSYTYNELKTYFFNNCIG